MYQVDAVSVCPIVVDANIRINSSQWPSRAVTVPILSMIVCVVH
jgi:hypothetical protein